MLIYKIFRAAEWQALQAEGQTRGSAIDQRDGFIHFSAAHQVEGTAARHFADERSLVLATVAAEPLGAALAWEPSRGGDLFPHLYGVLRIEDVIRAEPLPLIGGVHQVPLLE
jgi:uncharacterized protein (DUF952 family)